MVVFNNGFYGFNATSGVRLLFLVWKSWKDLDKVNVVLFQVYNLELCLVDFLYVQKSFFLDNWILFLFKGFTNDWQDDFPTTF